MEKLNDNELMDVDGGSIAVSATAMIAGIAIGITFIIGLIDGMVRPLKCN